MFASIKFYPFGGPGWTRTNGVSYVTALQAAAIATMRTDPYKRLGRSNRKLPCSVFLHKVLFPFGFQLATTPILWCSRRRHRRFFLCKCSSLRSHSLLDTAVSLDLTNLHVLKRGLFPGIRVFCH